MTSSQPDRETDIEIFIITIIIDQDVTDGKKKNVKQKSC